MTDKNFKILIELLQLQIETLNENGLKLYDIENPEFYVSNIAYNSDEDKIYINFEEEKR